MGTTDTTVKRPDVFVCKYGDKYIRFESYSTMKLVDFPGQGTIYRRKQDALNKTKRSEYYLDSQMIKATALTVACIMFSRKHVEYRVIK